MKHVGDKTPVLTCFYVREEEDKVVGMINIRLVLNTFLLEAEFYSETFRQTIQRTNHCGQEIAGKSLRARDCGQILACAPFLKKL